MRHLRAASATLLALAAAGAAEPAPPVEAPKAPAPLREYTTQPMRTIAMVGNTDPKQVAKAALFVTEDGGRSWRKDQELPVPEGATAVPNFTFTAPKDGAFGLWTVATSRDGRSEPEPVPGAAPKLELVVDRAAPSLGRLEATLGGVDLGQATVAVSWQIADPNLGAQPVAIEVSTDQGKSFAARHQGAADGTTALTVPAEGPELQVRLVARDLAGNVLTSPARPVTLPVAAKPANAEAELAAAVAALPAPSELGVAARSGTPMVTAGESPLVAAEPAKPAAAPAAQPATADQPTGDQPTAAATPAATPAAAASADRPARSPKPAGPRATAVDPAEPFLTGAAAAAALETARKAEMDGDVEVALAGYLRLHRSSVAKAAIEEELNLLRRQQDYATIVAIVEQLPPELRTDPARLHAARACLQVGDAESAAAWAAKVRASAGEAREAMLVLGKALKTLGRSAEARRVLDQLAAGSDDIAVQAREAR